MTINKYFLFSRYASFGIWPFFLALCFYYAVSIKGGGEAYLTADWLINFYSGPVRRGLIGTAILSVSDFGFPLLWTTYVTQVIIYFLVFFFVQKLYLCQVRGPFWLIILFSPTFLMFPFYDMGGAFRKEIIAFLAFSYLCVLYTSDKISKINIVLVVTIFAIAAFSHELTVFTLPFFLHMIYSARATYKLSRNSANFFSIALALVSALAALFTMLYSGVEDTPDLICKTLVDRGLNENICSGAITWLNKDTTYAIHTVLDILSIKAILTFGLLGLSLLPLFFTTWVQQKNIILVVIGLTAILPLFFMAIDWGRWIHIVVFMTYCVSLTQKIEVLYPFRKGYVLLGFTYLTTWSTPHCCLGDVGKGMVDRVTYYGTKVVGKLGF